MLQGVKSYRRLSVWMMHLVYILLALRILLNPSLKIMKGLMKLSVLNSGRIGPLLPFLLCLYKGKYILETRRA
jgi:hypothetical protein